MKILPPHDDERVYAWIILPVCIVVLAGALVLGAAFDTWGQGGIYENLFTEAVGVIAEVVIVYLLIKRWLDRKDRVRWQAARRSLLTRLEDSLITVMISSEATLAEARDGERSGAEDAIEKVANAVNRMEQDLSLMQPGLSAEMAGHLSTLIDSVRDMGSSLRAIVDVCFRDDPPRGLLRRTSASGELNCSFLIRNATSALDSISSAAESVWLPDAISNRCFVSNDQFLQELSEEASALTQELRRRES